MRWGTLLAAAVIVAAVITVTYYQRWSLTGPYRVNYEGEVLDKSITIRESRFGSSAERRLLIKEKRGEKFYIVVGPGLYERARIGMWIKNGKSGVELFEAEPNSIPAMSGQHE